MVLFVALLSLVVVGSRMHIKVVVDRHFADDLPQENLFV